MTLLLRKVAILLVLVLALPPYYLSSVDAEGSEGVIDVNLEKWRDVQNEGKKLLLLMCKYLNHKCHNFFFEIMLCVFLSYTSSFNCNSLTLLLL